MFGDHQAINLRKYIQVPNGFKKGLVKCRVTYNKAIQNITFEHYQIRKIKKVALVKADEVTYQYKYENRNELYKLRSRYENFDEIIMSKNGLITDAYYYNIVIKSNNQYFTPSTPLLKGTMRNQLLENGTIIQKKIPIDDLMTAEKVYLINALTPLGKIVIHPSQIEIS